MLRSGPSCHRFGCRSTPSRSSTAISKTGEVDQVAGLPRINRTIVDLYKMAGSPPAISPGHLRVVAAMLRIAQFRAIEVDNFVDVDACRVLVAQLQRGTCDVLVSGKRLAGSTAIASLRAIILARPTIDRRLHQHMLSRLDRSMAGLTIIDMVGNCERHGLWTGAVPEITVGDTTEVINDPALDHLTEMTHKQALAWAGSNIRRIVLLQKAKGKDRWSYHVIESTCGKAAADEWWRQRNRTAAE